jgi:PleD family two-component response regulator
MTIKPVRSKLTNQLKEIFMATSDQVQPESVRMDNLRDDILYYLLNKVKHSAPGQDVSYSTQDFGGKTVNKTEVIEHLDHLIREEAIEGEMEKEANTTQSSDDTSFSVTCKNAKITSKGENLARVKYFKV